MTHGALDHALESHGIKDESLGHDLLNAYLQLSYYSEVPETLVKLKQYRLYTAILSNGSFGMLEAGVRNSGLE